MLRYFHLEWCLAKNDSEMAKLWRIVEKICTSYNFIKPPSNSMPRLLAWVFFEKNPAVGLINAPGLILCFERFV
jgi:hypothetical protein